MPVSLTSERKQHKWWRWNSKPRTGFNSSRFWLVHHLINQSIILINMKLQLPWLFRLLLCRFISLNCVVSPKAIALRSNMEVAAAGGVEIPASVPVRVANELLQAGHRYLDVRYVHFIPISYIYIY